MGPLVPMQWLQTGERGRVAHVGGEQEQVRRLYEVGIRPGCEVEMVQRGVPCIVRVAQSTFCFRCEDHQQLEVLVHPLWER